MKKLTVNKQTKIQIIIFLSIKDHFNWNKSKTKENNMKPKTHWCYSRVTASNFSFYHETVKPLTTRTSSKSMLSTEYPPSPQANWSQGQNTQSMFSCKTRIHKQLVILLPKQHIRGICWVMLNIYLPLRAVVKGHVTAWSRPLESVAPWLVIMRSNPGGRS